MDTNRYILNDTSPEAGEGMEQVTQTVNKGEELLLRAKSVTQQIEERVRRVLQDEREEPRGPHA